MSSVGSSLPFVVDEEEFEVERGGERLIGRKGVEEGGDASDEI